MIKKLMIALLACSLLFFSCKSGAEVATDEQPVVEQSESDTTESAAPEVKTGQSAAEKPKAKTTAPEKKPVEQIKPKKVEPEKKPAEQLKPKAVEPKVDPAKAPAEKELKRAQTLMADAQKAQIDKTFKDEFASAKTDLNNAERFAQSENYTKAKTEAEKASNKFETLLQLNDANSAKTSITTNQFEGADAQRFSNAEISYIKALENFDKDSKQALKYAKSASGDYNTVLEKGYVQWINTALENAANAKAKCDGIRASKSASAEYKKADEFLSKGKAAQKKKDYNEAHKSYIAAFDGFNTVYDTVSVLRAEALEAMKKTTVQQQISTELAAEADRLIPLSESSEVNEPETSTEPLPLEESPVIENAPEDAGLEN